MPANDTYFRQAIDWFYGENAYLHKQVPEELGEKHVNELLGRHPWHPFDPSMGEEHRCFSLNRQFGECMGHPDHEAMPLHMKHVACYHPLKVELMKCLVREKHRQRSGPSDTSQSIQIGAKDT